MTNSAVRKIKSTVISLYQRYQELNLIRIKYFYNTFNTCILPSNSISFRAAASRIKYKFRRQSKQNEQRGSRQRGNRQRGELDTPAYMQSNEIIFNIFQLQKGQVANRQWIFKYNRRISNSNERGQLVNQLSPQKDNSKTLLFDDLKSSDLLEYIRRDLERLILLLLRVSIISSRKLYTRFIPYTTSGRAKANRIQRGYIYIKRGYTYITFL